MVNPFLPGAMLATGGSADVLAYGEHRVVKRFRRGTPLAAAMREAACTRAARDAGAPAPQTFDVVEQDGHVGVVFERVDGQSMLAALLTGTFEPAATGRSLAQLHAGLHALATSQLPEQRQRLQITLADAKLDEPARCAIRHALARVSFGNTVCHGDFHPGNILLGAQGAVVIDWYDATRGHPLADVAQTRLLLLHAEPVGIPHGMGAQVQRLRATLCDAYLAQYRELCGIDPRRLAEWTFLMAAARLAQARAATERAALATIVRDHVQRLQSAAS